MESSSDPQSEEDRWEGLVHVYTGDGKGKTTASLGLGLRAAGHGYKVIMIQFMKGQTRYGELEAVNNYSNFEIVQFGRPDFVDKINPAEIDIKLAQDGLEFSKKILEENNHDLVILDEINVAADFKLISVDDILDLISKKPKNVELIITGRYADSRVIQKADLVSEILCIKHYYQEGVKTRKGIEW